MELEKIYQAIITGRAMLITGSGAHMTALGMTDRCAERSEGKEK